MNLTSRSPEITSFAADSEFRASPAGQKLALRTDRAARIIHDRLALAPGTRLGPYEIQSAIGATGRGYRATDTTLGRQVAIKVLPDAFSQDAERLARFEREAKTLASLNHPHIAQIYGLEMSSGIQALVMELVEGEDLSQWIARGRIRRYGEGARLWSRETDGAAERNVAECVAGADHHDARHDDGRRDDPRHDRIYGS